MKLQLSFAAISGIRNLVTKRVLRVKLLERSFVVVFALLAAFAVSDAAQSRPTDNAALPDPDPIYGARLEGFDYPWPVALFRFQSQGHALEMAYMDVKPGRPTGRVHCGRS
jgi:hypothetical protein